MRQMTDSSTDKWRSAPTKTTEAGNNNKIVFLRQYLTDLNTKQFTMQCKEFEVEQ